MKFDFNGYVELLVMAILLSNNIAQCDERVAAASVTFGLVEI